METEVKRWLREECAKYTLEPIGIYRVGATPNWPLHASTQVELTQRLNVGGHLLSLPKEPAALANILEVSIVDFLTKRISETQGADARRGTERGYPDIEIFGSAFGGGFHAVDIKVARRASNQRKTQSRITLYTGNTYFRYPELKWPGTFRPFSDYQSHLDVVAIYTLNEHTSSRIDDLELLVLEPWRIASRQRSSTTREYLGAVQDIDALRSGKGEFESEEAFYRFWRKFPFKTGRVVEQQLQKLLRGETLAEEPVKAGPKRSRSKRSKQTLVASERLGKAMTQSRPKKPSEP
jgi:hypothetical protein